MNTASSVTSNRADTIAIAHSVRVNFGLAKSS